MDKDMEVEALARAFAALGNADRLRIIGCLLDGGQPNCGDVAKILGLSAPGVSYHLRTLESAGLIQRVRRGQRRCVLLTPRVEELVRPEVLRRMRGGC